MGANRGNLGAWGIDFEVTDEHQVARLSVDLVARTARGELDGAQVEPVGEALQVVEGSFQGWAVLWDLSSPQSVAQQEVVSFERSGSLVQNIETSPSFFMIGW